VKWGGSPAAFSILPNTLRTFDSSSEVAVSVQKIHGGVLD
jgi:hypothetical protein